MADVFLSYARADRTRAEPIAGAIEASGLRLVPGSDATDRVLVAWSRTGRESLWVRAEANEALDQGKLVQLSLDGAKLPLPFAMLHWTDLRGWAGGRGDAPWPQVARQLGVEHEAAAAAGRRPDPGGIALFAGDGPALQGFAQVAALGWAALATAALLALCVLMVVRRLISAEAFAVIGFAALAAAAALFAVSAFLLLRTMRASRR
jgi:hypothetical protein